jgi:hypothetical protein
MCDRRSRRGKRRLYRAPRSRCHSHLAQRSGARRSRMKRVTARRQRRVNEESSQPAKTSDSNHRPSFGSGHITPLFSGRATTCHARRRRAHVDVSRSAATACYVRLPPNLSNCDHFGLRWTLRLDLRRTKGTALHEADDLHGLPPCQRRDRRLFNRTLAHPTYGLERSRARARALVRATGGHAAINEDSTERPEADADEALCNAAALAAGVLIEPFPGGSAA